MDNLPRVRDPAEARFAARPTRNSRHAAAIHFAIWMLWANLRNRRSLGITLGVPLFMLVTIWLPSLGGAQDGAEILQAMFPAIVILSVIMAGLPQAARLAHWREAGILQRLALTPVSCGQLIAGASLMQVALGVLQGFLMLLFGAVVAGCVIHIRAALLMLGVMMLAAAAFICLGSNIGALIRKPEQAGYAYFFTLMPLVFLASFPADMLPATVNAITPWLPTTMAVDLLNALMPDGMLSIHVMKPVMGLLVYTALFGAICARLLQRNPGG